MPTRLRRTRSGRSSTAAAAEEEETAAVAAPAAKDLPVAKTASRSRKAAAKQQPSPAARRSGQGSARSRSRRSQPSAMSEDEDKDGEEDEEEEEEAPVRRRQRPPMRAAASPRRGQKTKGDDDDAEDEDEDAEGGGDDGSESEYEAGREEEVEEEEEEEEGQEAEEDADDEDGASPRRSGSTPKKAAAKLKRKSSGGQPKPEGLFGAIVKGGTGIQKSVDKWLRAYSADATPAMIELLDALVKACGCREPVKEHMLGNIQAACSYLTENFLEQGRDYPLRQQQAMFKKFESRLAAFLDKLITACPDDMLLDQYFLDTLMTWLTALCSSQVRAFRHTATFMALKIARTLIAVRTAQLEEQTTLEKQLASETGGSTGEKKSSKAEAVEEEIAKHKELVEEAALQLENVFTGIIIHRYRDIYEEIRAITVGELGHWIIAFSEEYLKDKYLKYLGWLLNDKHAHVRRTVVESLETIFSTYGEDSRLDLFTERFKERLFRMLEDVDDGVVQRVLNLLCVMVPTGILTQETEVVWMPKCFTLVCSDSRAISQAAGKLVKICLVDLDLDDSDGDEKPNPLVVLRVLINFSNMAGAHIPDPQVAAAFFVDALWPHAAELQDWAALKGVIVNEGLEDEEDAARRLSPKEETFAILTLLYAAQQAIGELHVHGKKGGARPGRQQERELQDAREAFTDEFKADMPDLLAKFSASEASAQGLVEFLALFDLDKYSSQRDGALLDRTLRGVTDLLLRATTPALMDACAATLASLHAQDSAVQTRIGTSLDVVVDELSERLSKLMPEGKMPAEDNEETLMALDFVVLRLAAVAKATYIEEPNVAKLCLALLTEENMPKSSVESIQGAIEVLFASLAWQLNQLDVEEPSKEAMRSMVKQRRRLSRTLLRLITDNESALARKAFNTLSDLALLFPPALNAPGHRTKLALLAFTLDEGSQETMFRVVDSTILQSDELEDVDGDWSTAPFEERAKLLGMKEAHDVEEAARIRVLASFCKAVVAGLLHPKFLGRVFRVYLKNKAYGDLLKHTLNQLRETDTQSYNTVVINGLQQLVSEAAPAEQADALVMAKELAHRLALTYGVDARKHREGLVRLHREAIVRALMGEGEGKEDLPPRLYILEIAKEFAMKLATQDKKALMAFLDEQLASRQLEPRKSVPEWAAYYVLAAALTNSKVPSGVVASTPASGRAKKSSGSGSSSRKRKSPAATSSGSRRVRSRKGPSADAVPSLGRSWGKSSSSSKRKSAAARRPLDLSPIRKRLAVDDEDEEEEEEEEEEERDEGVDVPALSSQRSWFGDSNNSKSKAKTAVSPRPYSKRSRMSPKSGGSGGSGGGAAAVERDEDEEDEVEEVEEEPVRRRRPRAKVTVVEEDDKMPLFARATQDDDDDDDDLLPAL